MQEIYLATLVILVSLNILGVIVQIFYFTEIKKRIHALHQELIDAKNAKRTLL